MLLEGAPLKAASRQGGRERFANQGVSSATGDPGGFKMKGDGDWKVGDPIRLFGVSPETEILLEPLIRAF